MRVSIIIFLSIILNLASQAQVQFDKIPSESGDIEFKAIYHASIAFKFDGLTVLIDPHGDDKIYKEIGEADLIVITDFHFDHYDV